MPVLNSFGAIYPSIEEIFNSTRVFLNDTFKGVTGTLGEGRIFTDTWTPAITTLNLAIQALQRDLENMGIKTTTEEVFYASLPSINGVNGACIPDPSAQCFLSWDGFFDGSQMHGQPGDPVLPLDFMVPMRIQERITGSNTNYVDLLMAEDGLPSQYQTNSMGEWEWRGDALWFNGSVVAMDIRVRYRGTMLPKFPVALDPNLFTTTFIPFQDCADVLAYRCAYIFSSARLPDGAANGLMANYEDAIAKIANRWTHSQQRTRFVRDPYAQQGDAFGWGPG